MYKLWNKAFFSEAKTSIAIQKNSSISLEPECDDSYIHCRVHNGSPHVYILR
jgi:hypothetical protein